MYEKVQRNPETTVREARCGDTWMRWNDFQKTRKNYKPKILSRVGLLNLSHVHTRKKMRVWHV